MVDVGATYFTKVDNMVMAVVVDVVSKEDLGERARVMTHMNSPASTEHSWQRPVYTLQINGDSSPCDNRIIFKK